MRVTGGGRQTCLRSESKIPAPRPQYRLCLLWGWHHNAHLNAHVLTTLSNMHAVWQWPSFGSAEARAGSRSMVETSQSLQEEKPRPRSPLIVGVGASASASSSIERFFSKFSPDPGQAIVLVLQHREAFKEDALTGMLKRLDGAPFFEIKEGS